MTRREGDTGGMASNIPIGKGIAGVGNVFGEGEGNIWLGWIHFYDSVSDGSLGG